METVKKEAWEKNENENEWGVRKENYWGRDGGKTYNGDEESMSEAMLRRRKKRGRDENQWCQLAQVMVVTSVLLTAIHQELDLLVIGFFIASKDIKNAFQDNCRCIWCQLELHTK